MTQAVSNSTAQIKTSVNEGSLSPRSDKESIVICQYIVITYNVDLRVAPSLTVTHTHSHTHWLYVIKFMIHEVFYVRPRDPKHTPAIHAEHGFYYFQFTYNKSCNLFGGKSVHITCQYRFF